jgi:hypothetical protein
MRIDMSSSFRPSLPSAPHARARRGATAALLLAGWLSTPAGAADTSGLGAAFRPQEAAPVVQAAASGVSSASCRHKRHGVSVIVIRPEMASAVVDDRLVRVGDSVRGMRVARIDAAGVMLVGQAAGHDLLTLAPLATKRPVAEQGPSNRAIGPAQDELVARTGSGPFTFQECP